MSQATFTFRVDGELKDSFTAVAKSLDRSGAQLLRDYMRDIIRRHKEAEDHGGPGSVNRYSSGWIRPMQETWYRTKTSKRNLLPAGLKPAVNSINCCEAGLDA